jgi:hypothetical protein
MVSVLSSLTPEDLPTGQELVLLIVSLIVPFGALVMPLFPFGPRLSSRAHVPSFSFSSTVSSFISHPSQNLPSAPPSHTPHQSHQLLSLSLLPLLSHSPLRLPCSRSPSSSRLTMRLFASQPCSQSCTRGSPTRIELGSRHLELLERSSRIGRSSSSTTGAQTRRRPLLSRSAGSGRRGPGEREASGRES